VKTLAVVGLGYVGLPLAVAFGKKHDTIGFDLDEKKLANYRVGRDPSGEVDESQFSASRQLAFTSDPAELKRANIIIVAVPTPIDHAHQPDLRALQGACRTIAANLSPGTIVVFESTVYPGCTEEICIPTLEAGSRLAWLGKEGETPADDRQGFFVGYSPERINPGDKERRLETIVKVVSGDTPETLDTVAETYSSIIDAGVYKASSIKVAEAAKVIENTQRDLNIALMNELALIFHKIGIDTLEVLETAGTKWNFLPFRPGLVGGHCIGVDPYYLTHKAEAVGHHPQVILAGRQTNDSMGKYIAEQTVKQLAQKGRPINGARIALLGLTFKEDCPDLRNSKVIDIIRELQDYHCSLSIHDPAADSAEAMEEYGVELTPWDSLKNMDAVILAVAHKQYRQLTSEQLDAITTDGAVIVDVKSILDRQQFADSSVDIWRL